MTSTVANRLTNVETAADPDALLGIEGIGQSPRDEITIVNNTDQQLDGTVTTTNFRIVEGGSGREASFLLEPTGTHTLQFTPQNGNVDDVQFTATIIENGSSAGTIELQRTITIPPDPTTTYRIKNVHSGLVLTPEIAFQPSIHLNIVQDTWNGSTDQEWILSENDDETFQIQNEWLGALGIQGGSTAEGINVALRLSGGADTRWKVSPASGNAVVLRNDASDLVADVEGGSTSTGANVVQWGWKGNETPVANQKWIFEPV